MMVKRAGMSEKYGKRTIDGESEGTLSQTTREISDNEIKRILQVNFILIEKKSVITCSYSLTQFLLF